MEILTLTGIVSTVLEAIIGTRADEGVCRALKSVADRLGQMAPPVNHDLQRAVRRARLTATLLAVQARLRGVGGGSLWSPPEAERWLAAAAGSLAPELARLDADDYIPPPDPADNRVELLFQPHGAPAQQRVEELRKELEEAQIAELVRSHGAAPEEFVSALRDGWEMPQEDGSRSRLEWFPLLCAFFIQQLKQNQAVANVVQGQLLANLSVDGTPLSLELLEDRLGRLSFYLPAAVAGRVGALLSETEQRLLGQIQAEGEGTRTALSTGLRGVRENLEELNRRLLHTSGPVFVDIGERPPREATGRWRLRAEGYPELSSLEHWEEWLSDPEERHRVLVIHGPAGRGKSLAAKQLRERLHGADPAARHLWLDCSYRPPRREELAQLFSRSLPEAERPAFVRTFPATFDRDDLEVAAFLQALGGGRWVFYLDDLDAVREELESPRSFLHAFLRALPRLPGVRIVATSRTREIVPVLQAQIAGEAYEVLATDPALAPLDPDHSYDYLRERGVLRELPSASRRDLLERLVEATGREPLQLRLIADLLDVIRGARTDPAVYLPEQEAFVREILERREAPAPGPLKKQDLYHDLGGVLFAHQLRRLPPDTYDVALAAAVLTWGYPADAALEPRLLRRLSGHSDLKPHGACLQRALIATGEPFRFDLDAAREFLYDYGRVEEESALEAHRKRVAALHCTAGELYEERGAGALAAWHFARGGRYRKALRLLEEISPRLEADFRFADLLQLRTAVCEGLRWALDDPDARAHNDAQLAEIRYQGYDECEYGQKAWQLAAQVASNYEGDPLGILGRQLAERDDLERLHMPEPYRHHSFGAYAQANLMLTIIAFETRSGDWERLARDTQAILELLEPGQTPPTLRVNLRCHLGVFYNRGARISEALSAYSAALEGLGTAEFGEPIGVRRDRLRILVNRSRTLFLSAEHGPDVALAELGEGLRAAGPEIEGTQEHLYGLVNGSYFLLGQGDTAGADTWIRQCVPYRRDRQGLADRWIFDYVSAVEAAVTFYRGDYAAARERFTELSRTFGYPRDEALMAINACLVELAELLARPAEARPVLEHYGALVGEVRERLEEVADEPIAAETLSYLLWALPRVVEQRLGTRPAEAFCGPQPDDLTVLRTRRRFGGLMFGDAEAEDALPQRLPVLMRGALILRSRPLAPLPTGPGEAR